MAATVEQTTTAFQHMVEVQKATFEMQTKLLEKLAEGRGEGGGKGGGGKELGGKAFDIFRLFVEGEAEWHEWSTDLSVLVATRSLTM